MKNRVMICALWLSACNGEPKLVWSCEPSVSAPTETANIQCKISNQGEAWSGKVCLTVRLTGEPKIYAASQRTCMYGSFSGSGAATMWPLFDLASGMKAAECMTPAGEWRCQVSTIELTTADVIKDAPSERLLKAPE